METSTKVLIGLAAGWIGGGIVATAVGSTMPNEYKMPTSKVACMAGAAAISCICGAGTVGVGIYKIAKAVSSN